MGTTIEAPVLLTGYDVKRCQRRVHNDHDPTLEKVPWEPPADLQKRPILLDPPEQEALVDSIFGA